MAVLTGQLGTASSYPGNMILGSQGCIGDFFDGQLGTADDYCGNMILAVANFCQPASQVTNSLDAAANNTLVLTQTLALNIVANKSASNSIVFTASATRVHVIPRSASNTLIFTENAQHVKLADATNNLVLVQSATYVGPFKHAEDTLVLVDVLSRNVIYNRSLQQTFQVVGTVDEATRHHLSVSNSLNFSQALSRNVKFTEKFINQHLTVNQNLERFKQVTAISNLVFYSYATFSRTRNQSVSNILTFNQNAQNRGIYNRSITQILNVHNGYQRLVPGIGIITDIPGATGIVSNCFVLLASLERELVLPCPQFDDTQEWSSLKLLLKRSIIGDTRTYVRRSGLAKLKYTFWLGRQKSLELRQFLLDFIADDLVMTNYKGELWLVKFAASMNDLIPKMKYEPERERVDIILEFEGTKLY